MGSADCWHATRQARACTASGCMRCTFLSSIAGGSAVAPAAQPVLCRQLYTANVARTHTCACTARRGMSASRGHLSSLLPARLRRSTLAPCSAVCLACAARRVGTTGRRICWAGSADDSCSVMLTINSHAPLAGGERGRGGPAGPAQLAAERRPEEAARRRDAAHGRAHAAARAAARARREPRGAARRAVRAGRHPRVCARRWALPDARVEMPRALP